MSWPSDLPGIIAAFFRRHGLTDKPGLVAVSGGPDSVALAHVLVRLHDDGMFPSIALAHVNHQLRGEESDGDETFVRSLPACWNRADLRTLITRIDIRAHATEDRQNLEAAARDARYSWLAEQACSFGAGWIATGHTADDQAETVLFRLFRGTGVTGLSGVREIRPLLGTDAAVVRPMLAARRGDVLRYLGQVGQGFREDSSNQDPKFSRNRIRRELLPLLERDYHPEVVDSLGRLADQSAEIAEYFRRAARELARKAELARAGDVRIFRAESLRSADALIVVHMFRLVWEQERWPMGEMGQREWRSVLDVAVGARTAWDFPAGIRCRRDRHVVQVGRFPPDSNP